MKPEATNHNTSHYNRRRFLKTAALAGSAASVGAIDLSRGAYAAGSDVIRVGMIGCGGRNAGAAVQALNADPGARLVAMHDIFSDRIRDKRAAIKTEKGDQVDVPDDRCFPGFGGYKSVIECSDVVLIANAAKFHPLHTLTAIQAGKHVFTEKPHAIDPYGIKMMERAVDLAREKRLSVVSGLHSRYHPGYAETVQRIQEGAIGEIISIEENFLRAPYGITQRNPAHSELEWQCSTQYHFNWLSGDDVPQSLVHNLDRATWALGEKVPLRCHGLGGRSTMTDPIYGNVFDHHSVIYHYEDGVRLYAFCRTTTGCYDESSSILLGSKGQASVTACRIWGENNWRWQGQGDPYQIEHDRLFAAIRSGNPLNNGDYMTRSTLISIMGQISCYTGEQITWDRIRASDFGYAPKPEDCHDGMEPPVVPGPDGTYPVFKPGVTRLL
jgi:myo-inositol 2-dehydrogenase / D-chiro-inositol 1-dehydrogenase